MVRPKMKSTLVRNVEARKVGYLKRLRGLMKKITELTILCDLTACLIFVCRDDDFYTIWPTEEVAKSLITRFLSLSDLKRTMKSDDQESFIKTNTLKIEKKLADSRRVIEDIEMDFVMAELQNGYKLEDLSPTQIEKLKTYSDRKLKSYSRELNYKGYTYASVNDYKPDLVDVPTRGSADWGVNGFRPMGSNSNYLFDEPEVSKPWDHKIRQSQGNELSNDSYSDVESSDDSDIGSSSSSDGADDS